MRAPTWAFSIAFLVLGAFWIQPARGQAVISTRSGLVHFFEGAVSVAGQPLESHPAKFTNIPRGSELRTERGNAEVLLTPGVFLRVGENSAIRLIENALSDTRVELLAGAAIVHSLEPGADTSVTLIYKGWNLHQAREGEYRLDGEPARLLVKKGEVEASPAGGTAPIRIQQGMELRLAAGRTPEKSSGEASDALSDWADGRAQSIAADNTIAANIQDPASMPFSDAMPAGLTYFPMLGLSPGVSGLSSYGTAGSYPAGVYGLSTPYQPGFYSIYLPGYTHPPLLLGLRGTGLRRSLVSPSPIAPISPLPRSPISRPAPGHSAPRGGARAGHR
jgi:hypothetical protein